MQHLVRIKHVEVLEGFHVRLQFTDGTYKEIDLEPYLHGPIFEPLRTSSHAFRTVQVDHELGTIVWDNGADIDPDVLYENRLPAWMDLEITQ